MENNNAKLLVVGLASIYLQTIPSLRPLNHFSCFIVLHVFDGIERSTFERTGDMTLLTCFSLFAHPSNLWLEYGTQELRCFGLMNNVENTVRVKQICSYLMQIIADVGVTGVPVVLRLKELHARQWLPSSFSWEHCVIRPTTFGILIVVAGFSPDYIPLGSLAVLFLAQAIAVLKNVADGSLPSSGDDEDDEELNVIPWHRDGTTIIVKSTRKLFTQTTSSNKKACAPKGLKFLSTALFMVGLLLVGLSDKVYYISYVAAHMVQGLLLLTCCTHDTYYNQLRRQIVNGVEWVMEVDETQKQLPRHEERDVCVCLVEQIRKHVSDREMGKRHERAPVVSSSTTHIPRLPPELINKIFKFASSDRTAMLKLSLVCHTASHWMIPTLYGKLAINSASELACICGLFVLWEKNPGRGGLVSEQIHSLWINDVGVLRCNITFNTIQILRIIAFCRRLRTLALFDITPTTWRAIEDVLPNSLEDLTLNSSIPLSKSTLNRIKKFTSVQGRTEQRPESEIEQIINSPSIHHFRRIFGPRRDYYVVAFDSLDVVRRSSVLQKMELVVYGESEHEEHCFNDVVERNASLAALQKDDRMTVSVRWECTRRGLCDTLYHDFLSM